MEQISVHKFGGASVKNADSVKNVGQILSSIVGKKLVVISAMGKTTNALESIHHKRFLGENYENELQELFNFHFNIASELGVEEDADWNELFENLSFACASPFENSFDAEYDRLIGFGEYLSTAIVNAYLTKSGLASKRINSADYVITDNRFRDARVQWEKAEERVEMLKKEWSDSDILLAQGFIGATEEEQATSLGREGSDFSAAIFAFLLHAHSVTIWKDVPGLLNADPKCFTPTKLLSEISFREAVELAYYGASVIHPRTVKPLQNKNISLHIKSFVNPTSKGTTISNQESNEHSVPSYILTQNQTLISISTKDFSFVVEDNLTVIFNTFSKLGIHVHMMENSALNFSACIACEKSKLDQLVSELPQFNIRYNEHVSLLTVKYPLQLVLDQLLQGKEILLEQRNRTTTRFVLRGTWMFPEPIKN